MVNEEDEDDIVKEIEKAFGINPENTNYSKVELPQLNLIILIFKLQQNNREYPAIQSGYDISNTGSEDYRRAQEFNSSSSES